MIFEYLHTKNGGNYMSEFLDFIIPVLREAGEMIMLGQDNLTHIETKKTLYDYVTEVDKNIEKFIFDQIKTTYPEHGLVGEERFSDENISSEDFQGWEDCEYTWIVDPVDGTTNYIHGSPEFAVSVGLARGNTPILGVTYSPSTGNMYWGESGSGAFLNGKRLSVSKVAETTPGIFGSNYPTRDINQRFKINKQIESIIGKSQGIRMSGCASLQLARVASGFLSGHWEYGLSPWDIVAGYVLITEAGGKVTSASGKPYSLSDSTILASNGLLHETLLRMIKEVD